MDYQKLREEFVSSGLSQKKYAEQKGISPSMVSYYLKKSRTDDIVVGEGQFREFEVISSKPKRLFIRTTGGVEIEIPL